MQLSNFTRSYGLVTRTFLEFSYLAVASDEKVLQPFNGDTRV